MPRLALLHTSGATRWEKVRTTQRYLFRLFLSTRGLMVVVALVALVLSGGRMWTLRRAYLQKADEHARSEQSYRRGYALRLQYIKSLQEHPDAKPELVFCMSPDLECYLPIADYHARMQRKYAYASAHPWVSVGVDPPKPPRKRRERWEPVAVNGDVDLESIRQLIRPRRRPEIRQSPSSDPSSSVSPSSRSYGQSQESD